MIDLDRERLRALVRAFHGYEVSIAVLGIGVVIGVLGLQTVPSLDHGTPLHLATLGPSVIAAVSSVATSSKIAPFAFQVDLRLSIFRGAWCVCVAACCGAVVWPAALAMQRPMMVSSTVALVGLTFAVAPLVGAGAWIVGAADTLTALAVPRRFGYDDPASWIIARAHLEAPEWCVLGLVVLSAVYAIGGALREMRSV